jgi:hypothetical protein
VLAVLLAQSGEPVKGTISLHVKSVDSCFPGGLTFQLSRQADSTASINCGTPLPMGESRQMYDPVSNSRHFDLVGNSRSKTLLSLVPAWHPTPFS